MTHPLITAFRLVDASQAPRDIAWALYCPPARPGKNFEQMLRRLFLLPMREHREYAVPEKVTPNIICNYLRIGAPTEMLQLVPKGHFRVMYS